MAIVAEKIEVRAEPAAIVVPTVTVSATGNVTGSGAAATVVARREKPPHAATRAATRVGEEAGAAMMTADTHAVTEEATGISTAAAEAGETARARAHLAGFVGTITAIATTARITEAGMTTATEAAAPLDAMPPPS